MSKAARKRLRLTKSIIDKLEYPALQSGNPDVPIYPSCIYWDTEIRSFAVRVFPSGKKSYILDYRCRGRHRRMTIGSCSVLTLHQARERVRKLMIQILDGVDPLEVRESQRKVLTVTEFSNLFIERYAKKFRKSWKEDARRLHKHVIPAFGSIRLDALQRGDISAFHAEIGESSPVEANRVTELFRRMFHVAMEWGYLPSTFENPAKGVKKFPEKSRERVLTEEEIIAIGQALIEEQNVYARTAITLALHLGNRIGEILKAKWRDVNLKNRTWLFPDTKSGKQHTLPLTEETVGLLESIPRDSSTKEIFPIKSVRKAWERIRKKTGLENIRIHDLRRSAASMMVDDGISLHIVSKVLNHSSLSITSGVYAHVGMDPVEDALQKHSKKIVSLFQPATDETGGKENVS